MALVMTGFFRFHSHTIDINTIIVFKFKMTIAQIKYYYSIDRVKIG